MASFQILPSKKFDFAQPKQWSRWHHWFERFRQASDLDSKSKETQVNTLIYSMGEEVDNILHSSLDWVTMTERSMTQYQTSSRVTLLNKEILSMNDEIQYAQTGRRRTCGFVHNVTLPASKTLELLWFTRWHDLRSNCGLRDSNLSERLQSDPELTLGKAITMARWTETVRE